jgi:hypothetical protein
LGSLSAGVRLGARTLVTTEVVSGFGLVSGSDSRLHTARPTG